MKTTSSSTTLKNAPLLLGRLALCMLGFWAGAAYAADPVKGGEIYTVHCASCHGAAGDSVMLTAPNFNQGEGLMQPDLVILNSIKSGKNAMPAYRGILSDRDILDVVAYLRTLN